MYRYPKQYYDALTYIVSCCITVGYAFSLLTLFTYFIHVIITYNIIVVESIMVNAVEINKFKYNDH